jgi:hypothetical protein
MELWLRDRPAILKSGIVSMAFEFLVPQRAGMPAIFNVSRVLVI